MKKTIFLTLVLCILCVNYNNAQLSKFVKNVKNNVQKDLLGGKDQNSGKKTLPEPASACTDAQLIVDLGGKLQVDYSEIGITSSDDGRILLQDIVNSNYYIVKDGVTQGPYKESDPIVKGFKIINDKGSKDLLLKYQAYITKSGDKFLISFMGKQYGPFAQISQFVVARSRDKFVAIVTESLPVTEDAAKKMEEAMKNAKTDQEKYDLSMQYAQEMGSQMMKNGGPNSMLPKFITNIPGATYDPIKTLGAQFDGNFKYDEILLSSYDKIMDLKGKTIFTINQGSYNPDALYISSDNSRYAIFSFGTLTFNDKSTLPDVFNPHWLKADGKIYLAYMYYSPRRNSIMQCKIPF
jgi:hypothetical protein